METKCDYCGESLNRKPSHIKRCKHHFCSKDCKDKWISENIRGENHPQWTGEGIKKNCLECGKEFYIRSYKLKSNLNIFCSRKCTGEWASKNRRGEKSTGWRGGKVKRICQYCGKEFEVFPSDIKNAGGIFCSRSCLRRGRKGFPKFNTKPELIAKSIFEKNNLPFKYTGDGSFWIENINPDFVECNGKKIAIEVFGDYWHSPLLRYNIRYNQTYEGRKKILKKYGWGLIVLWEADLKREDAEQFVLRKVLKIL